MSKVNLADLQNLQNEQSAVATVNANNQRIEDAIDNTLSRDGTTPNQMNADIDMNSHTFLNVGDIDMNGKRITGLDPAVDDDEPLTLAQLTQLIGLSFGAPYVTGIAYVQDAGSSPLTTGVKGDLRIPFAGTINSVTLLADAAGSLVVDIWKTTFANAPPTVTNTICGVKPTLSSTLKYQDSTLSGWNTAIQKDDILRFNIDSVSGIQRFTLILKVTKT